MKDRSGPKKRQSKPQKDKVDPPARLSSSSNRPDSTSTIPVDGLSIKGVDDFGNFYNSHQELLDYQHKYRMECYQANEHFWQTGGCGGKTDEEAMTGDTDGVQDSADGLDFLDRLSLQKEKHGTKGGATIAIDVGAGVGRITKLILLKRYQNVRLIEGNTGLSDYSHVYLGRKRSTRCEFTNVPLQNLTDQTMTSQKVDLIWVQWTLQYLLDVDVIECLHTLAKPLLPQGVMVVKENRPFGTAREDRFQMDTHGGENHRYDITRPDAHHRLLFQRAGLRVQHMEKGVETHTYALCKIS